MSRADEQQSEIRASLVSVDASVVIRSLIPSQLSDKAQELLEEARTKQITLIAPALLPFEVTSTLRRQVYLRAITLDEGEKAFGTFLRIPISFSQRKGVISLAWQLAKQFNLSKAYDTAYLAVAQMYGCELWTADEKLYNAVENKLPWVKRLADYAPGLLGAGPSFL